MKVSIRKTVNIDESRWAGYFNLSASDVRNHAREHIERIIDREIDGLGLSKMTCVSLTGEVLSEKYFYLKTDHPIDSLRYARCLAFTPDQAERDIHEWAEFKGFHGMRIDMLDRKPRGVEFTKDESSGNWLSWGS
jgi:hypothetical protein